MTACIVGWSHGKFGKLDSETSESLVVKAASEAIAHAGIEPRDIDVPGLDAGMGDGVGGRLHDQRFAGLAIELAELAVGPSDDAGRHGTLLRY